MRMCGRSEDDDWRRALAHRCSLRQTSDGAVRCFGKGTRRANGSGGGGAHAGVARLCVPVVLLVGKIASLALRLWHLLAGAGAGAPP